MKLIYVAVHSEEFLGTGIKQKIESQIKVFKENGIEVSKYHITPKRDSFFSKITKRLPFTSVLVKYKYNTIFNDTNFIYIRYHGFDYQFIRFLKKIKQTNKSCKILLEIPTYPYENETITNLSNFILILKDRWNRRKLHKYIDRVVVISDKKYDYLFKIKAINIINGIDFELISPKKCVLLNHQIEMISVARFSRWHGCEFLIDSIARFSKKHLDFVKKNVKLHIVGDGPEIINYKKIVADNHLENIVIFHGVLKGKKLFDIYDISNIAIESLNRKSSKIDVSSSLKSREYLAKGLPIISGCKIDILDKNYKYLKIIDINNLNFEEIIDFYDSIYAQTDSKTITNEIRNHAYKLCDIHFTLQPILNYIFESTGDYIG